MNLKKEKRIISGIICILFLAFTVSTFVPANTITSNAASAGSATTSGNVRLYASSTPATTPTPTQVYNDMVALKSKYPEGTPWTNDNYYAWKGGIYSGGYGCAGFAFILSDAAFGTLKARTHTDFNDIKVGDILRINNDTHSVVVLEVNSSSVVIAEGNYNSSIHWGRLLTRDDVQSTGTYVMTRYPQ